jgi:hypothetical protein
MPIDKSSRYAQTKTVMYPFANGETWELINIRDIPKATGVFYLMPIEGDRLDLLAYRYYRDALKFWRICDASEQMDPFDVVHAGEPLLIPPNK